MTKARWSRRARRADHGGGRRARPSTPPSGTRCGRRRARRRRSSPSSTAAVVAALADPTVRERFADQGQDIPPARKQTPRGAPRPPEGRDREVVADHPEGGDPVAVAAVVTVAIQDSRRARFCFARRMPHATMHLDLPQPSAHRKAAHRGAAMDIRPLSKHVSAEVRGVDTSMPLADDVVRTEKSSTPIIDTR